MSAKQNIIERIQRGDWTGLKFAGLVRLSFELLTDADYSGPVLTGNDINNREEQERLIRERVQRFGGTYVGTYNEPDTSAWKKRRIKQPDGTYKSRVIRPVLYGALADLKSGYASSGHFNPVEGVAKDSDVQGLIVLDLDRLTRDQRTLEDIIEVADDYSRPFVDLTGTLDLLTENGQDNARMLTTMAGKQSSATARRVKTSHLSRAMRGIPVGGNRAFGWDEDKRTLVYLEAIQIRAAARLLLAGMRASTIIRKWNESGRRTTKGNLWRRRTFVLMMTSPRMVGYRVYGPKEQPHHTRYLVDEEGNPVKGQYPAILDEHTWHSVVALLAGPDRPGAFEAPAKVGYMLSGIIRCAACGKKIYGNAKGGGKFDYACKINDGGCGKACGAGLAIDSIVTNLVLARLEEQRVTVESEPWGKEVELEELNQEKKSLLAQYNENSDMGPYIFPKIRKAEAAIAALIKERTAYARKAAGPKTKTMATSWPNLVVEQKNAICGELIEAIMLQPATRGSNRFNPARLQVVWREG
ncbi:recombinase family protein [Streptomyces sp. NPDC056401]|uniref:recombinase family protein n=1 Tax=Streptomyces sp. NPDC056401 TaxID=3345809 RepID=UPI0035E336C4